MWATAGRSRKPWRAPSPRPRDHDVERAIMSAARAQDEQRPRVDRVLRERLPIAALALGVVLWELVVRVGDIPPYVLPGPRLVFSTLISDWAVLSASLLVTLTTTLEGFLLAAVGGVGLAVLFNQSRLIEYSLYPYAVI